MDLEQLSDSELYRHCQALGERARVAKRQFAGLLPEVLRRGLHRRRGCASIYEFAFKIGGLSRESVDKVLRLDERLQDKPELRKQLIEGSEGWSKIEKVAYIATPETDHFWAKKVTDLPRSALEVFVSEKRQAMTEPEHQRFEQSLQEARTGESVEGSCLQFPERARESFSAGTTSEWGRDERAFYREDFTPGSSFEPEKTSTLTFKVRPELESQLRLCKIRLERQLKKTLSFEEVLEALLSGEGSSQGAPQVVEQVCPSCAEQKGLEAAGRAIPRSVKRVVQARYGDLCSFRGCKKPATSLHHTQRYALHPGHHPDWIVPLCTAHERLVHSGLIENESLPPDHWVVLNEADPRDSKFAIDRLVSTYRSGP